MDLNAATSAELYDEIEQMLREAAAYNRAEPFIVPYREAVTRKCAAQNELQRRGEPLRRKEAETIAKAGPNRPPARRIKLGVN